MPNLPNFWPFFFTTKILNKFFSNLIGKICDYIWTKMPKVAFKKNSNKLIAMLMTCTAKVCE